VSFGRIVQAVPPDQPFHASIDRAFHQNEPREKTDILFARDFKTSLSTIQWVATGYTLALATVIPLTGWAADRFGTKRLYMISISLFSCPMPSNTTVPPGRQRSNAACRAALAPEASRTRSRP